MADAAVPTLPRNFGRYEVAGTIAAPRCAEGSTIAIAIARPPKVQRDAEGRLALNIGPAAPNEATKTIQRPIALKRIAPELTKDSAALGAFIESAFQATEIRHPNVAEILEVHHEASELFLVMNWVMGETAASVVRRLHSQGERLKPTLAAYVIAEACAGLEAGHSKGIVHAHLTPQDILIGYDGSVHVLDIGIAAARRTLAGGRIAGVDIEYASPELCKRDTLDRRSDVFSLGTILWELLTGLSPFERASDGETMRAICDETAVAPKNVVPGLPVELSTITLQALSRDRGIRQQTALALRSGLLQVVKKHGGTAPAGDQLGQLMQRLFEGRDKDKREMLRRVEANKSLEGLDIMAIDRSVAPSRPLPPLAPLSSRSAAVAPPVPRPSADDPEDATNVDVISVSTISAPAISNAPPDFHRDQASIIIAPTKDPPLPVGAMVPSTSPPSDPPRPVDAFRRLDDEVEPLPLPLAPRPSSGKVAVAIVVGIALIGALVFVLRQRDTKTAPVSTVPDAAPTHAAQRDVPPPPPPPPPSSPAPIPSAVATASAIPAAAEETVLHIDTIPTQSTISIAGVKQGVAPVDIRLPKGTEPVVLEIRHPGYVTLQERVVPDMNQRLKLTLARGTKPSTATAPTGSAGPYHKFE